ncbi:hypothetical protein EAF00_000753 [Botryotinia globosa]|nr:hypothetical protein EAF00_000753 [Botryotinia globosa]
MKRSLHLLVLLPSRKLYPASFLATGGSTQLVSRKLTRPCAIIFDTNRALPILQQEASSAHVKRTDEGNT